MRREWQSGTMRWKHLHIFHDRFGKLRVRFRRKHYAVMLPQPIGGPEFIAAYQAALDSKPAPTRTSRIVQGTLDALVTEYLASPAFTERYKLRTKDNHRCLLGRFARDCGTMAVVDIDRVYIKGTLADASTHNVAKHWLKAVRPMLQFAVAKGMLDEDPSEGIKPAKRPGTKSEGHHTWTEDEIARYRARHPIGSMARLALDLLLLTGQRRGDIVNLGRKNLITMAGKTKVCLEQEKTGAKVSIPLLPELAESIRAATATAEGLTTFLISKSGQAFNSNYFGTCFNAWAVEAGLPERCTPHGLRKAFCRRLANQGKTPHEIAACTGHKTLAEVERYCREFDRERAAERAMAA